MKVTVSGPKLEKRVLDIPKDTRAEDILALVKDEMKHPIYLCILDNCYRALTHVVYHDCNIEFLDIRSQAAWVAYQNSLMLLFIKSVHDVLGKKAQVAVKNSLNKGLYIRINKDISDKELKKIDDRMRELVEKDLPIKKEYISKSRAINLASDLKQKETYNLLRTLPSLENVEIYSLDDEQQIFYSLMIPSTSYLKYFELRRYQKGFLLRYPHQNEPTKIPEYSDDVLLYNGFKQSSSWGKLMNVNYVSDLNQKILDGKMNDLYLLQEALHEKRVAEVADEITKENKRLVLICGPSSSGKTTFANRLCIQLQVNGKKTLCLGTDDYFVERDQTPLDKNGEKDYESIKAVDTKLFIQNMEDLLSGKLVDLPIFDFIDGTKRFGQRKTKISEEEIIVVEGIHALNQELTAGINESEKFKIYISPFSPICIDRHNRIPFTDARMIRRLVRDYQFRGRSAKVTINDWPKVRAGEDNNIFPYINEAEVFFNSNCIYEFAVLKKYAEPLLNQITRDEKEYAEAQRMLGYLRFIGSATDDTKINQNSIIREFIGGSSIVK